LLILKKIFLFYFSAYLAFTPLLAYGSALQVDGTTNTTLDYARNGTPIVNIANPNTGGLSHNSFSHYNVGVEGLILNNANQTNIDTQLGGIIFGNQNLNHQASAILLEVSSTNRSSLNGWTEIAGQRSDLIIANPNGLTINGAGFINTNALTLTTGRPTFNHHQLSGFIIGGGDIQIEGAGLDVSTQDSASIYSHYLQLNAKIHAKNLDIKLGKNTLDNQGNITQSFNSGQVQNLLLDTSNLGGMYAGRITLVGTDQGLGINLPPEVLASSGDIFMSNDGIISLQKLSATGVIQIASNDTVVVNDNLYSEQTLDIQATTKIDVRRGIISAQERIDISSHQLNNQAQIMAGLTADGVQNKHGILTINATKIVNQGDIQASQNLTIVANELDNQTNANIIASHNLDIKHPLDNNTDNGLITNAGNIQANQQLNLNTHTLDNHHLVIAKNATLEVTTLNNHTSGTIHAVDNLTINADNLDNDDQLSSDNTLNITTTNDINNQNANITALGDISITANNFDNQNAQVSGHAKNEIKVSQTLDNSEGSISAKALILDTNSIDVNQSSIYASEDLSITVAYLDNVVGSDIGSGGNLIINAKDYIINNAELTANGDFDLITEGSLTNNNLISSEGALLVSARSLVNHQTISGGIGDSQLNITDDIVNHARISSQQNLNVAATNISNNGFLNAARNLTLTASHNLTNHKTLFSGNDMQLFVANELHNAEDSNIFAFNHLSIAKNTNNDKTNAVINDKATIQTYQGDINIYATLLENQTNNPDVVGSYDKDTQSITGGLELSRVVNGDVTTIVEAVILNDSANAAQINSGSNLDLTVDYINNQYSAITAANDIHLHSEVLDNQAIQIVEVTTISTKKYNDYRHRHRRWRSKHNHHDYIGTETVKNVAVIDIIAPTIQAGGSITGNLNNFNNTNINDSIAVSTNPIQTQTTDTTANTQSISPQIAADISPQILSSITLALPQDEYGLFVQTQDSAAQYLIESNPEFTLYGNFISSDYLLEKVNFNPDKKLKLIGDGLYEQTLVREQLLAQTGRRFLQTDISSDNAQYQRLMDNAIVQQQDLELTPGISLSVEQINRLSQDMVWMEPQNITLVDGTIEQVLVPKLYLVNADQYRLEGGKIIAAENINLNLDNLNNAGLLQAGDNISLSALNQITNQGGTIQANNAITLLANNDINNHSADIKAQDISLVSTAGNINITRFEQQADYSKGGATDTKKIIGKQSNITANNLELDTTKTINLIGSKLEASQQIDLNADNINLETTIQQANFFGGDSHNYLKEQSTTHLVSQIEADNININAAQQTNIKGSTIQADNQINIQSEILDISSVKDSTYAQSHSESKGGLFGGGHNTTTTTQTQTNIQGNITAKDLNINTTATQIQASTLQAQTIQITTELLSLVTDQDLDFKQVKSDSSGFLTKTITDKGHKIQTKSVAALIATDKLSINNTQLTTHQTQTLKQLTSSDLLTTNLQAQLTTQGISLNDVQISNQNWDESTTTLSGLGKIIVQVAAMAMTGGTGSGFVNAAISSLQNQLVSAMLESAITGTSLQLNPKQMLKTALTAGASQYAMSNLGVNDFVKDNVKNPLTQQMSIVDYAKNAVVKGTAQGLKTEMLGGEFKDGFKTAAITSVASDGAMQMRRYAETFETGKYSDGSVKIEGSHRNTEGITQKDPLGGSQTGKGKFFGSEYNENGIIAKGLKLGAGPHDAMSSWNYKNYIDKDTGELRTKLINDNILTDAASGLLLIPTIPFAIAPVIEDNLDIIQQIKINIDKSNKKDKKKIEEFKSKYQFDFSTQEVSAIFQQ
jgi:filamentous hemagglutinin